MSGSLKFSSIAIAIIGLSTSVLTAILSIVITEITGVAVSSFSMCIIPIGAILTGVLAASGYYFSSLYFHRYPNFSLLLQMVFAAGLTQFLISYLSYIFLTLDDGTLLSSKVSFLDYVHTAITKAQYRVGKSGATTGEVGSAGYWLAVVQSIGFLLGGFFIYAVLSAKPICPKCKLYLRSLASKKKSFVGIESATTFASALYENPPGSPEFAEVLQDSSFDAPKNGTARAKITLFGCPGCDAQTIDVGVEVQGKNDWDRVEQLSQRVPVMEGANIVELFKATPTRSS